jgi:hypothetical protein
MIYEIRAEAKASGFRIIDLIDGAFSGISYTYGEVKMGVENGKGVLHFDYDIIDGEVHESQKAVFKQTIGNILFELLDKQLNNSEVIYAGGVD